MRTVGEAVITISLGIVAGRQSVCLEKKIDRSELREATVKLNCGNSPGIHEIIPERIKFAGEANCHGERGQYQAREGKQL